jgi:hypothetical protein
LHEIGGEGMAATPFRPREGQQTSQLLLTGVRAQNPVNERYQWLLKNSFPRNLQK